MRDPATRYPRKGNRFPGSDVSYFLRVFSSFLLPMSAVLKTSRPDGAIDLGHSSSNSSITPCKVINGRSGINDSSSVNLEKLKLARSVASL